MLTKVFSPKQFMLVSETKLYQQKCQINQFTFKHHLSIHCNQKTCLNYNSRYQFWKFSSNQNIQSTQQSNQELQNVSKSDTKLSKISIFNIFNKSQSIIEEKQKNIKSKNYLEQMKNSQLNFLFQEQVSKLKDVGKASYKYFLIGIFVLGFAYSIPKSISTFLATKMAISTQLSIENLKKENEMLKSKLELVKNKIEAESTKVNDLRQKNIQ
ncbi:unnamed protein product (macronuclear) [Paramecium tetraurelia]|uniref:Transmembrane protein n=1 Tax=Paramecium tetraurelia TaxID=5888 RepID=A0CLW1_PARTE|nr:uncharacterized protein GSPATT00038703001 [Paramecium tetraurelia]CAK71778.1 unnamed protein product [Paramecium tetraurelia]|eukprot:XP_001439175.1 hypothetical protein (macronuclear) [Paramecium tetraurelia strain d4-2]